MLVGGEKFDDKFSRFDTLRERERQTDRQKNKQNYRGTDLHRACMQCITR